MLNYDIAIIGAGPGGYVAAIRAAQLGAKTLLIEKGEVGGVCLNRGCIPTKALAASADRLRQIRAAGDLGIGLAAEPEIDFPKVMSRKNKIVARLVKGIHQLIKGNGIDLKKGTATLLNNNEIRVANETLSAKNIIIATGSREKDVPNLVPDGKSILTSNNILQIEEIPASLCVVGGGVIGCEFASIFRAFGSEVTIVEALPNIISTEDPAISQLLERALKKQGITIMTNTTVSSLVPHPSSFVGISLSTGENITTDKLLISVGRSPSFEDLGIEALKIKTEDGAIVTSETMSTNVPGIYAIGDVNGKYMLAHVASAEAIVAVDNIMGQSSKMNYAAVPRPIYTWPEVACVGPTESELQGKNIEYSVGKSSFAASPKALCDGTREGQLLVYAEKGGGRVLGAAMVGDQATELVSELALAITTGLTADEVARTIHSHPTLAELVKEAAEDSEGRAIHKIG